MEIPVKKDKMVAISDPKRKSGISILGDAPWGTHFCHFYHTKQDLIDILVPYFKAGLENNEFCMWVTSEPLTVEEARAALQKAVPDLDQYNKKGQIEILDFSQWYTRSGKFEADKVLQGWVDKEQQARKNGFEGLRLTGNTFWIEHKDWKSFSDYEATINNIIDNYKMLAICSYSLDKCDAYEILDVFSTHQFALINRHGKWVTIESSEHQRAEEEIAHLASFPMLNPQPVIEVDLDGRVCFTNNAARQLLPDLVQRGANHPFLANWPAVADACRRGADLPIREVPVGDRWYQQALYYVPDAQRVRMYSLDITERQRVEEALRRTEENFRRSLDDSPLGVRIVTTEGETVYANRAMLNIYGYDSIEELRTTPAKERYTPESYAEFQIRKEQRRRGEFGPSEYEISIVRKNGEARHLHVFRKETLWNGERQFQTLYQDITARKRGEEALRESEEKHRTLFETMAQGTVYQNAEGHIISANPTAERLLGLTLAQMLGRTSMDPRWKAIHEDGSDFPGDTHAAMIALKTGKEVSHVVMGVFHPGANQYVWINIHAVPQFRPGETKPYQVYTTFDDITERKRAEEALKFTRFSLDNAADTMVCVDRDGRFIDVNGAFCRSSGYSREELFSMTVHDIDPDYSAEIWPEFWEKLKQSGSLTFESCHHTKGGKVFPVEITATFFEYKGKEYHSSFARDITERKRAEAELQEKSASLERFTYAVSHDLRSPLVTVKTFLGYLEQDLRSSNTGRIEKDVFYMRTAADKMGQLLDELLKILRVGHVANPPVRVTFRELVEEALNVVAGSIARREVKVKVQVSDAAITLYGDRPRLVQIWQNLVENAVKFMGDQASPRIEIGAEQRGGDTVFFVRDNGIGIDPLYQAKVFDLFGKIGAQSEGEGLGLALIKRIVELYRGTIWLESKGLGQGACFLFTLPGAVKNQEDGERS